jgi:hypothetical protein
MGHYTSYWALVSTNVAVNAKQARTSSWRIIGDVFLRAAYMLDHCLLLIGEASIIFGVKLMELCRATARTRTWLFIFLKWGIRFFFLGLKIPFP